MRKIPASMIVIAIIVVCLFSGLGFLGFLFINRNIQEQQTKVAQTAVMSRIETAVSEQLSKTSTLPIPTETLSIVTPTPTPTQAEISTIEVTPLPRDYVVKQGDTLWGIAQLYGIPYAVIANANNITDPELIWADQVLHIPDEPAIPTPVVGPGKYIVVSLATQRLYAYEDGKMIMAFLVSTGKAETPTPTGEFEIYLKYEKAHMTGPGYDTPDVPWTMYFNGDYAIHGTYWHNRFGMPMSHGCVNLSVADAEWLYYWADVGTKVKVIP